MSCLIRANIKKTAIHIQKNNAAQNVLVGAAATIQYQNVIYDIIDEFNPLTYTFTPLHAGIYLVSTAVYSSYVAGDNHFTVNIIINGVVQQRRQFCFSIGSTESYVSAFAIVELNPTQTLWVTYENLAGNAKLIQPMGETNLRIIRIS